MEENLFKEMLGGNMEWLPVDRIHYQVTVW